MAKSKTTNPLVVSPDANVRTVRTFDFTPADQAAAAELGIVIGGAPGDRITRAVTAYNQAARLAVEAGYLLLSTKGELQHGEFEDRVEDMGLTRQRASELMRMAKFATSLPEASRAELLTLPKTKVLALAGADPEVIEQLLEEGADDLEDLSVRDLRQRIRDLQAELVDGEVRRDVAENRAETLRQQLASRGERADKVPRVVADLRAEIAELAKKAELALDGFQPLGVELVQLAGTDACHDWADASLRQAVAALAAIHLQTTGLLKKFLKELPGEDATPTDQSRFSRLEIVEMAQRWQVLTQAHEHEKALREWEAEQKAPKGKGRPKAKPEAPKGVK